MTFCDLLGLPGRIRDCRAQWAGRSSVRRQASILQHCLPHCRRHLEHSPHWQQPQVSGIPPAGRLPWEPQDWVGQEGQVQVQALKLGLMERQAGNWTCAWAGMVGSGSTIDELFRGANAKLYACIPPVSCSTSIFGPTGFRTLPAIVIRSPLNLIDLRRHCNATTRNRTA